MIQAPKKALGNGVRMHIHRSLTGQDVLKVKQNPTQNHTMATRAKDSNAEGLRSIDLESRQVSLGWVAAKSLMLDTHPLCLVRWERPSKDEPHPLQSAFRRRRK